MIPRALRAFLGSRWLWRAIGLALLGLLVWAFGPLLGFGAARPLASPEARLGIALALALGWLAWLILARRRAIRANRLFVSDLAEPAPRAPDAAAEGVAAVNARFGEVLGELKRRKLGGRRFLRDMPWYVIIGPPASGKTTALRQSGLGFPFDLTDDLQGVGGTRNCDWFFTEDAVLIDTAGRYTEQASDREADAAEWFGFLDLLKRHRGRRALNGVIVAVPVDLLLGEEAGLRAQGREIRKRLAELGERLEIRLPVYLLLTKADLLKGFEATFEPLSTEERQQVWGATLAPGEPPDGGVAERELAALVVPLEARIGARMRAEDALATRAEIFRFPAQVAALETPLRLLVDTVFGASRYERSAWLRGFYLTSATQEGAPIDRLVGSLGAAFGLPLRPSPAPPRIERRGFFLRQLLTEVIFGEAGLATLDPRAEARRVWLWRGGAVAAGAVLALSTLAFSAAYIANRGAAAAQAASFERLRVTLAPAAVQQAPVEPSDLALALEAVTAIENAATPLPGPAARLVGPSAAPRIAAAQAEAYDRGLRNLLEPRMVALLEAAMWRHIRDPEFLLGALKTYRMMTGLSQYDAGFVADWWANRLPEFAATPPFPTEAAFAHQMAAIALMAGATSYTPPDDALVEAALQSVCSIPLSRRAYDALRSDPAAAALPDWTPASFAGPNGAAVLTRRSGKTLRAGIDGIFTHAGFHGVVRQRLMEVAAQAAIDRSVFAGGCPESAEISVQALADDMLKLYYEDYIAQWDGFLRDVTLAPLPDLRTATENLKDLASADSALRRLLTAVVAETDLARPEEAAGAGAAAPPKGVTALLGKLGKLGKLAKTGAKHIPTAQGPAPDMSGQEVSDHFKPIKAALVETDGAPPTLDATVAALAALANVLQTISASLDPEAAIKDRGGLGELTGAVANEAGALPPPLDGWLAGIAGETTTLAEEAVGGKLNAIWTADILPFCKAALTGRYPFAPDSRVDVTIQDFARLFAPGGLMDAFTNDHLLPYVDTAARPWRWRADLGLDDRALAAFETARRIRDAFFIAGGSVPVLSFTLEPKDLSASAGQVRLNLDGQSLDYFQGGGRPRQMTWPGPDGTTVVTLAFQPADGSPDVMMSEIGSWAWLRLIGGGRLRPTGLPEVYRLRLAYRGHYADFELRAASVENPFDLRMFAGFACPSRI